jgi:hypothetical protein
MQQRVCDRLRLHLLWLVLCLSRHTITGLLYTGTRQFLDWTADYRLYSRGRVDVGQLFDVVRQEVESMLPPSSPLVVAMDDSILRKSSQKIPGVAWRVDPLGPPFQVNFVLAHRVVQLSAAVPTGTEGAARSIPIDFVEAPTPQRPGKKATPQQIQGYRELQRQMNINVVGAARVAALRQASTREIWLTTDGRFTNRNVIKRLPERTMLIGRIRADACLYAVPPEELSGPKGGRPRRYGKRLPRPEQVLGDATIPWQTVKAYAAGKVHEFRFKTVEAVKWRPAGAGRVLRLVVIAPLAYRLCKEGRTLYRKPAYLMVTDASLPLQAVVQAYLWRWGIEVNFRDEKSVMGVGEAQVRNEHSVKTVPAVGVAAYAMLLLAGIRTYGMEGVPAELPDPKWLRGGKPRLCPTQRLIAQLRLETWGQQMRAEGFEGFPAHRRGGPADQKPQKPPSPLASAVLYARKA